MRLWSIHPKYLDPQGLVALWREALLAQKVLMNLTRGYRHHPQLQRFQSVPRPVTAIGAYLHAVADEADRRGYQFDRTKIQGRRRAPSRHLGVSRMQLLFEMKHLQKKLEKRSPQFWQSWPAKNTPSVHPLFRVTRGGIATWERLGKKEKA